MKKSTDDANFACTACGKCCTSPPMLSVSEALELSDVFVSMVTVRLHQPDVDFGTSPEGRFLEMERSKAIEMGAVPQDVVVNGKNYRLTASLSASVEATENRPCPALLDDGRCGIYERRPNACRSKPLLHALPDQTLSTFLFAGNPFADRCDWSETAPPLLREGRVVNADMGASLAAAVADQVKDNALFAMLDAHGVAMTGGPIEISSSGFVEDAVRTAEGVSKFPMALLLVLMADLAEHKWLPAGWNIPTLRDFAAAQEAVIERDITAAVGRKNKSERQFTSRLRAHLNLTRMFADLYGDGGLETLRSVQ